MLDKFAELPLVAVPIGSMAETSVAEAVEKVCRDQRLSNVRLLRQSMNAVYQAEGSSGPVVMRVCRPTTDSSVAIEFAQFLARRGFEVPAPIGRRSFRHDEIEISLWEFIDHDHTQIADWSVIGTAVKHLHAIDPADVAVFYPLAKATSFPWWDFSKILAELTSTFGAGDHKILTDRWQELEPMLLAAGQVTLGDNNIQHGVLCHGDVHPGNVLVHRRTGRPILIDWDLLCVAPAQWDHSALLTWSSRWGGAENIYDEFVRGYGRDFGLDSLAIALAELRLLSATLMRWRAGSSSPSAKVEADRRMRWWRKDPNAPMWTAQ